MVQLSHPHMTTKKTIALTIWTFVGKEMSLIFNMLSRFVPEPPRRLLPAPGRLLAHRGPGKSTGRGTRPLGQFAKGREMVGGGDWVGKL